MPTGSYYYYQGLGPTSLCDRCHQPQNPRRELYGGGQLYMYSLEREPRPQLFAIESFWPFGFRDISRYMYAPFCNGNILLLYAGIVIGP